MGTTQEIDIINEYLKQGRIAEARARVLAIPSDRLDREQRLAVATLTNHCFLARRTVQLLHRVVRPGPRSARVTATDGEKAEYAIALMRLEAHREARALLEEIRERTRPRVRAAIAVTCFRVWDWAAPVHLLEEGLGRSGQTPVQRLYCAVQLATARLHGFDDPPGARKILERVMAEARALGHVRLRWDALNMMAQSHYLERDWTAASRWLAEMEQIGRDDPEGTLAMHTRVWVTLVELNRSRGAAAARKAVAEVREAHRRAGVFWQVRSIEYYEALALEDRERLVRLYYGSPFEGARARVASRIPGGEAAIPARYEHAVGEGAGAAARWLDVATGESFRGTSSLKPGQLPQRLLAALVSDFYAPPTIIQLHADMYPENHFNPASSPARVWQAIKRLRAWLASGKIPLAVREEDGRYYPHSTGGLRLRLEKPARDPLSPVLREFVRRLAREFGPRPFQAAEVERACGVSRWTACARLREAEASGKLAREGRAASTRYRLQGDAA